MAHAATHLVASQYYTDSATSFATADISPSANALILLTFGVAGERTGDPVPSGGSLSYVKIADRYNSNGVHHYFFRAQCGASPGTFAITVTADGAETWDSAVCVVDEWTGHNTTSPITQADTDYGWQWVSDGVHEPAFDSAFGAGGGGYGSIANQTGSTYTPRTGWTQLGLTRNSESSYGLLVTEYRVTSDTNYGGDGDGNWAGMFGIEIAVAAAGGPSGQIVTVYLNEIV